ncbi:MAG: glycosyltransferase [Bacillota bacterium]
MRIAYLIEKESMTEVVSRTVVGQCALLAGRGHEIWILAPGDRPDWVPAGVQFHKVGRWVFALAFDLLGQCDAVVATHHSQAAVATDVGTAAPFLILPEEALFGKRLAPEVELMETLRGLPVAVLTTSLAVREWVKQVGARYPVYVCDEFPVSGVEGGGGWDGAKIEDALVQGIRWHQERVPAFSSLGLAMIVRDEQENLRRCLESVRPIVDQIVVVDTGSCDNTVAVAEELGAEVVRHDWRQDFAAARNASLARLSTDWVIVLDADECLTASSYPVIRRAILNPSVDGFLLDIINVTGEILVSGALVHSSVRLFRRRSGFQYEGCLHEQVAPSILRNGGRIRPLPGASILHYGYLGAMVSARDKKQRNLAIVRRQVEEDPRNAFAHFNLGMECLRQGDRPRAIKAFRRSFRLLPGLDASYAPALLKNLAACLLEEEKYQDASALLELAEEVYPDYVDLALLRGIALNRMKRYEEALVVLEKCVEKGEAPALYMTQVGAGSFLARMAMVEAYLGMGRFDEAAENYRVASREMVERLGGTIAEGRPRSSGRAASCWIAAERLVGEGDLSGAVAAYRELMDPEVRQELLPTQLAALWQRKIILELVAGDPSVARQDVRLLRGVNPRGADACAALLNLLLEEVDPQRREVLATAGGVGEAELDQPGFVANPELCWEDVVVPLTTLLDTGLSTWFAKACRWLASGSMQEAKLNLELGKLFFQRGCDEAAAQYLLASARAGVADAAGFWQLGELSSRHALPADARVFYRQAIRQAPKVPRYWISLALSYHDAGRDRAGLRVLSLARHHTGGEIIQATRMALEISSRLTSRAEPPGGQQGLGRPQGGGMGERTSV